MATGCIGSKRVRRCILHVYAAMAFAIALSALLIVVCLMGSLARTADFAAQPAE